MKSKQIMTCIFGYGVIALALLLVVAGIHLWWQRVVQYIISSNCY